MRPTQRRACESLLAVATFAASTAFASAAVLPSSLVANAPQAAGIRDMGRADARTSVGLAVMLKYRNEAALDQLLDVQRDPDSPQYHRFLSSEQFRNAFGPTQQAYARTIALLQHAGFTVTATFPNRTIVDVKAPAPIVERYFNTEIHRVNAGRGLHYANARPAYLPAELRDSVDIVLGFDNVEWFKPLFRVAQGSSIPGVVIGLPLHGPSGGFGPLAFAQGYDFPVQHQIPGQPTGTTYDGTGRTAAISIPGDPSDTDLAKFLTEYNVTRTGTTTRVKVDGGPSNPSEDTLLEASLDYETISGLAPGANMRIYEFPTFTSQGVVDSYNSFVSDNIADTINSSYGACETANIFSPKAIQKVSKQGLAQGQLFHASSGDDGTFTFGCSSQVSILTPADTPQTVAIGGTHLTTDANGNWTGESYWNNSSGAGGGGVSTVFKVPGFQKKVPTITKGGRNIPDVSYDADPDTGEAMVFRNSFLTVGGTSLASPIFGACMVELEQVFANRISGQLNKNVYKAWLKSGYGSGSGTLAHDITTGAAFGILKPGTGYDLATGIGSLECFVGGQAWLK